MLSDFITDSLVIALGLCMVVWGAITQETPYWAIGSIFIGAGAYEMRQRLCGC